MRASLFLSGFVRSSRHHARSTYLHHPWGPPIRLLRSPGPPRWTPGGPACLPPSLPTCLASCTCSPGGSQASPLFYPSKLSFRSRNCWGSIDVEVGLTLSHPHRSVHLPLCLARHFLLFARWSGGRKANVSLANYAITLTFWFFIFQIRVYTFFPSR